MASDVVEESYNTNTSSMDHNSAMYYRLGEAAKIIEDLELCLKGYRVVVKRDDQTGQMYTAQEPIDPENPNKNALANPNGVQAILSLVRSVINSQTVQGNFTRADLDDYICEVHVSLVSDIVENCYEWGIQDHKLNYIMDKIMSLVIPFMTRTIDNKERESYTQTLRTVETNTMREEAGRKTWFGGGQNA